MRSPGGHANVVGPPGKLVPQAARAGNAGLDALAQNQECDTFTCGHCQQIVLVPPRCDPAVMGGFCRQCMTPICPQCHDKGSCTPWEKAMERSEVRDRALRSYEV